MKLNHLFKDRVANRWHQYLKYLKYVFNDHAVLALFILAGAGGLAYQSLWQTAPINIWTRLLITIIIIMTFIFFKNPTNFIKPADPTALLSDETSLRKLIKQATTYSMIINGIVEGIVLLALWPMIFRLLTNSIPLVLATTIVLVALKMLLTKHIAQKQRLFVDAANSKLINWRQLVTTEENHQFIVLSFFNLFIDVPGITPRIKRQSWADTLISFWDRHNNNLIIKLYVTAFIRRTQYIKLWFRLTIFGGLAAWFTTGWLQTILLVILFYLLVLQLIPLSNVHQHIVFNFLYPISNQQRLRAFQLAMLPWLITTQLIWVIIGFIADPSINLLLQNLICLVVIGGILVFWYTEQKINKSTQRRNTRAFTK